MYLWQIMKSGDYPRYYWQGLAVLMIAYTLHQLMIYMPSTGLIGILKQRRTATQLMLMASIYVLGSYILSGSESHWMGRLWHIVHIGLISIALCIIVYKRFMGNHPINLGGTRDSIINFVISPLPYLCMGLLYRASKKRRQSQYPEITN